MAEKKVEKYPFLPEFERQVAYLTCTNPSFYGKVGHSVDPEALNSPSASAAVMAAHACARDTGIGPPFPLIVLQRMRSMMHDGKVTQEQIEAVNELFDQVEDEGLLDADAVCGELVPVLQRRLENDAIHQAISDFSKRQNLQKTMDILGQASRLGIADISVGMLASGQNFASIDAMRIVENLPTGVFELDQSLQGGLPRGQLGYFIGNSGAGKSMMLSQLMAFAATHGCHCAYATLEVAPEIVFARLMAAATDRPISEAMTGAGRCREEFAKLFVAPCWMKYFTPQSTTVDDLRKWVSRCEELSARPLDLLVVDYADRLVAPGKARDLPKMQQMELVYESLRLYAAERRIWAWTASQAVRGRFDRSSGGFLDLDASADSSGKFRVADVVITINPNFENSETTFFIAKCRTGESRKVVGPLPTQFSNGLLVPMLRDNPSGKAGQEILARQAAEIIAKAEVFDIGTPF